MKTALFTILSTAWVCAVLIATNSNPCAMLLRRQGRLPIGTLVTYRGTQYTVEATRWTGGRWTYKLSGRQGFVANVREVKP